MADNNTVATATAPATSTATDPVVDPTKVPVPIVNARIIPLSGRIVTLVSKDGQRFHLDEDIITALSETIRDGVNFQKENGVTGSHNANVNSDVLKELCGYAMYKYNWFLHIHTEWPDMIYSDNRFNKSGKDDSGKEKPLTPEQIESRNALYEASMLLR